ncbi:hypothetical protein HNQ80_001169 [Anaerosolibacter carboniphilus]|uniref:Uncharacterized protein n=1 Tax=Anaerosolibacter carboniphilus TaxID=1417629 RepID=A0A841KSR9_9FIRM|nr:hypothetical protein [Anaerosolibacter carboniphilus]MBB6215080.1 hypothetical protein [Anaerosolibacter carboniphilus]
MSILDYKKIEQGFKYSVNLKFDLNNIHKVKNYIPTSTGINQLKQIILSLFENSKDRRRIMIGPYGKGKSHFALMLLALLSYKDREPLYPVYEKIKYKDKETYDLIVDIFEEKKTRLLPVIIQENGLDLRQSLLLAVREALERENISELMPKTFFHSAIEHIYFWKNNYSDTYDKFIDAVEDGEKFIYNLEMYDEHTYLHFTDLYTKITSGGRFNPFNTIDVAEFYEEIVIKLKEKTDFDGIYIIYDEFSKYLEGSLSRNTANEIKILQDLAEKCEASGENQLHILLISHKSINQYTHKLPKEKLDAWRAVEGRFKQIEFINHSSQIYEIISTVLYKDIDKFENFTYNNRERFDQLYKYTLESNLFKDFEGKDIDSLILKGCYPLHPSATFMLPRLSEKVAQNDRTIFTFLSSGDKNSLFDILPKEDGFYTIYPDKLYDYFEFNFKKETYNSEVHHIWRKAENVLNKIQEDDITTRSFIKCLALINIINAPNLLTANIETMKFLLGISIKDFEDTLNNLINNRYIHYVRSIDQIKIIESSDIDINYHISEITEKKRSQISVKNLLADHFSGYYEEAKKYNDDYEMTRFFEYEYITYKELQQISDWSKKTDMTVADGFIYKIILHSSDEISEIKEYLKSIVEPRVMFLLPQEFINIEDILREYDSVCYLLNDNNFISQDAYLKSELTLFKQDLFEEINSKLQNMYLPEKGNLEYYNGGKSIGIYKRSQISREVSRICEQVFYNCPVIKNELINRSNPTGAIVSALKKVLNAIFENKGKPMLGLAGNGPDVFIVKTVLINTGILENTEEYSKFIIDNADEKIKNVFELIDAFIFSASNKTKCMIELINLLSGDSQNIGMRKGLIPIFLGIKFFEHRDKIAISSNGVEYELTPDLIMVINDKPEKFNIYMEKWNVKKQRYIDDLRKLFRSNEVETNIIFPEYEIIVKSMRRWFLSLNKYQKDHYISNDCEYLKSSLRVMQINSREFVFEKLPDKFGFDTVDVELVNDISNLKRQIDDSYYDLLAKTENQIKSIFWDKNYNGQASLTSLLKIWYDNIKEKYEACALLSNEERKFISIAEKPSNNEEELIEKLSFQMLRLRTSDWNDNTLDEFVDTVLKTKNSIEEKIHNSLVENSDVRQKSQERILFDTRNVELSPTGKILKTGLENTFEQFGNSVNDIEKKHILIEILKKFI